MGCECHVLVKNNAKVLYVIPGGQFNVIQSKWLTKPFLFFLELLVQRGQLLSCQNLKAKSVEWRHGLNVSIWLYSSGFMVVNHYLNSGNVFLLGFCAVLFLSCCVFVFLTFSAGAWPIGGRCSSLKLINPSFKRGTGAASVVTRPIQRQGFVLWIQLCVFLYSPGFPHRIRAILLRPPGFLPSSPFCRKAPLETTYVSPGSPPGQPLHPCLCWSVCLLHLHTQPRSLVN